MGIYFLPHIPGEMISSCDANTTLNFQLPDDYFSPRTTAWLSWSTSSSLCPNWSCIIPNVTLVPYFGSINIYLLTSCLSPFPHPQIWSALHTSHPSPPLSSPAAALVAGPSVPSGDTEPSHWLPILSLTSHKSSLHTAVGLSHIQIWYPTPTPPHCPA